MLAIATLRRVGVTDVSAGAVAGPSGTVVPASRILRHVAADGALIADLRRGHHLCGLRQDRVLLFDYGMLHNVREAGHRADLDAVIGGADSLKFLDSA